jgi:hypothetical protein
VIGQQRKRAETWWWQVRARWWASTMKARSPFIYTPQWRPLIST